ncbi:WYL domain-containing protein [Pectobacteriaceae bacterium CE70]|nr:WYL domain-containing protein [Pectobacteriaceae bacterium CE70]
MDIIITILFLCLAIFSAVVYFQSQGNLVIKFIKGIFAFSIIFGAIDVYKNEDQIAAFIMVVIVFCLSYRRFQLNKAAKTPLSVIKSKIDNNDEEFNHEETNVISSIKELTSSEKNKLRNISFEYTDSSNNSTYREVDVKNVDADYITGFCHSRRQLRTFRIDRIENSEIVVRNTGELINVYDWIVQLYEK